MPETSLPRPEPVSERRIREAVCINTARVYDSCADKNCISGLRVWFPAATEDSIAAAANVRPRSAEILNVFSEIEPIPFNNGYYSVDATYYFRVLLDVYTEPLTPPQTAEGLCVYSKKSILYGAEGNVTVFSSEYAPEIDAQAAPVTTNPRAVIQVATPLLLAAKFCPPTEQTDPPAAENLRMPCVPESVRRRFSGEFRRCCGENSPLVSVTIGLFSIIRMERDVQLLIPAYDFCLPTKSCAQDSEDPCDAFSRIDFPVNAFFPPEPANAENPFDPPVNCGGCRE